MEHIDLKKIREEHVSGTWEVKERMFGNENISNPFSTVREIEIKDGIFNSINGGRKTGEFQIVREDELVYNPQLKFYNNELQIANAIITRLFLENEGQIKRWLLTLYFTTGLELVLQKNI